VARPHIEVVAAVLRDAAGRVLLAQRPPGKALAGRWEFPGGKREPGEAAVAALRRELDEELGITALALRHLLTIQHDYPERRVRMATYAVDGWRGAPEPREGQGLAWVAPVDLPAWDILEADAPIVAALRLPDRLLITPEPGPDPAAFLAALEAALARGVRLVQLRAKSLAPADYAALARAALEVTRRHAATLLLNAAPELVLELGAGGVHLDGARLAALTSRPLPRPYWVSASVHDADSLVRARASDVDCVVLGPVCVTPTHPDATPLGWTAFALLVAEAGLPVYALGGLAPRDLATAQAHGAQGIAAIRGLWAGSGLD
jgi:8-oxo-dGTP diphosphatase